MTVAIPNIICRFFYFFASSLYFDDIPLCTYMQALLAVNIKHNFNH